jgi:hypothetical protein
MFYAMKLSSVIELFSRRFQTSVSEFITTQQSPIRFAAEADS